MKKLIVVLSFYLCFIGAACFAQSLDPSAPPTGDLDYAEMNRRIAETLPDRPDLLKFSRVCLFKFAEWPDGISSSARYGQEAFEGYSLKTDSNQVYLLDKAGHSLFSYDLRQGSQHLLAADREQGHLQLDDFALLRDNVLAVADNSRTALVFFARNHFRNKVDFDGERMFFRHIAFIEPDRLGLNLAVCDTGRNRSYVFDRAANLQWEAEGLCEPVFMGNALVRLENRASSLRVFRFSSIDTEPQLLCEYNCEPGNIILGAWAAGTVGGQLAIVAYEGRGDEDHPDYARLLLIKDAKVVVHRFRPDFDIRLNLQTPYRLLLSRDGIQLLTARLVSDGLEIIGATVPR
ncbi:MAG: hypothetical protein KKB51_00720 [Candidatus Riflebacteria bacterium]|nr:hypothetical protein [Candidatus Riflebacteria bacterium]